MIFTMASSLLSDNVQVLKASVSKTAYQGVAIAVASIIVATFMVSVYLVGEVSFAGIMQAQKTNLALWILNCVPFVFAFWGQYSSSIIAYEAGAMIYDQTQELRSKADDMAKQANYATTHDTLTDLPNRALFYDRVSQAINSANNQSKQLSILLIEIENFKEVYDTLGRNSSDLILKQIATRLQGVVLDQESVARIDGNVFAILLADIDELTEAEYLAQAIHRAMDQAYVVERLQFAVHSNVGIVHFPEHGEDVDSLVQRAGVALYKAQSSNNGYSVYEPSFDQHSPRRLTLMSELRNAIDRDELELYYQPKIDIQAGKLYGAEALVRWNHPKHGFISPDEFIPMAERTRTIKPLSLWVLKRAFQHCAAWHKQGVDIKISVNLSAKDLLDPSLPDTIAGVTASTSVKPEWIIFEITESAIMTDPEGALITVDRLSNMGFELAVDDFGTGYSSLAYLKKMPLTELKIDKSFVEDIQSSENDAVIVKATINLAHNLGLQVTAEGVENEEVLNMLKGYGCDIVQGYHLAKPLSVADFNDWLKSSKWQSIPNNSVQEKG
jgi:diguanylate cyclase (GGDEF)-like protein